MRILMTRPHESGEVVTKALLDMGHNVIIDPLIRYVPVPQTKIKEIVPSAFSSIVTTSQQAIRCLAEMTTERNFPLWCVGTESANIATKLGFQDVYVGGGSAKSLLQDLQQSITNADEKPILHLSGDAIRVDLVKALRKQGIPARRVAIYKTQEATDLRQETKEMLKQGQLDAILFYSPRTAKIFQYLCQKENLVSYCNSVMAVCLSRAIYNEIKVFPWKSTRISKNATTNDLLLALMMAD